MAHMGFADAYGTTSAAVDALFTRQSDGSTGRDVGNFLVVRVDDSKKGLLREVINVLMHGECGTTTTAPDPLLDWVYEGRTEGVYAPLPRRPSSDRIEWFRWMATYLVHFGINRKSLYALVAKESSQVVAACVCGPPRSVAFDKSYDEMGINIRKAGMAMAIEVLVNNPRMKSLGAWQGGHLPPSGGNFFYVEIFATAPEWQGKGCGSALLSFLGEVADADGVESFLETAGERNTTFYHKKGGYEEVVREPIGSFKHEGGAVSMRRPPKSNIESRGINSGRRSKNNSGASPTSDSSNPPSPPTASPTSNAYSPPSPTAASSSSDGFNSTYQKVIGVQMSQDSNRPSPPSASSPSDGFNPPSPPAASSSSGCDSFIPKQRNGPLSSYCHTCGGHRSKHEY